MSFVYIFGVQRSEAEYQQLSSEWLRALRGRRSQVAMSRRLGYRSNIAYRWEAGDCFPTAGKLMWIVERLGGNVKSSLRAFYQRPPGFLELADFTQASGMGQLLNQLRGSTSFQALSQSTGLNRFSLSRWVQGESDPPLPAFLSIISATTLRLADFIAAFTDPTLLPSLAPEWQRIHTARELAYTHPWTQAILRALELRAYRRLRRHCSGWLAKRAGVTLEQEQQALQLLLDTGQIRFTGSHYEPTAIQAVDTRSDPERARNVKAYWIGQALQRAQSDESGLFAYNLSAVSRKDLARLQEMQRAHYREMSRVIAESSEPECVVLYAAQLFDVGSS